MVRAVSHAAFVILTIARGRVAVLWSLPEPSREPSRLVVRGWVPAHGQVRSFLFFFLSRHGFILCPHDSLTCLASRSPQGHGH